MKKFLTITVATMALASQAASISWQLSPTKADGFAAGQTVLLFVGAANETFTHGDDTGLSLADYVNSLLTDGADAATAAAFDTTTTTSNARLGTGTTARTQAISYDAGSSIVGMIVVLDGNGKYNAFSLSAVVAGAGDTEFKSMNATSSTGFQDLPTAGGDTPAVPEPATGALALAGVALLFKRRRA